MIASFVFFVRFCWINEEIKVDGPTARNRVLSLVRIERLEVSGYLTPPCNIIYVVSIIVLSKVAAGRGNNPPSAVSQDVQRIAKQAIL